MVKPARLGVCLVAMLLLTSVAACGGGDDDEQQAERAVDGTFVGKVSGSEAFVAVVVPPATGKDNRREVTVYTCDAKRVCERFTGSSSGNGFEAAAPEDSAKAEGKLSGDAASGTIPVGGDEPVRFKAERARAAAGLYELTVSAKGRITGASSAGVALKGKSPLPPPGKGTLTLADGKRLKFSVTTGAPGDSLGLKPGDIRLIVLSGGQMRGAGKSRSGDEPSFFIRSAK